MSLRMLALHDVVRALQVLGKLIFDYCQINVTLCADHSDLFWQVHLMAFVSQEVVGGALLETNHVNSERLVLRAKVGIIEQRFTSLEVGWR